MKQKNRVISIYEVAVWFIYAWLFKYEHYMDWSRHYAGMHPIDHQASPYFPMPEIGIYAVAMTLYVIPFYTILVPLLLRKKQYAGLFASTLLYFLAVPKLTNFIISGLFMYCYPAGDAYTFFAGEHRYYSFVIVKLGGQDFQILLTDLIAFLSIAFIRFAFENERKKHLLEKDNLVLQLESLRAQLHPHFLFNTLNSIYGMSLTGSPETPGYILRLSDMMRFILYDCRQSAVPLEKDIEFVENYIAMEKQRYPLANIRFTVEGQTTNRSIAPLLFIPLVENSFKHGSHRVNTDGHVHGSITVMDNEICFIMENDIFDMGQKTSQYGGVGIENLRKRLDLYYPGKHHLAITNDHRIFRVELKINTQTK